MKPHKYYKTMQKYCKRYSVTLCRSCHLHKSHNLSFKIFQEWCVVRNKRLKISLSFTYVFAQLPWRAKKNGIKSNISRGAISWDQLISKERLCLKTKGWHNFMNTTTKNPSPLFLEQQLIPKNLCISRENIVWDSWLSEVLVRNIFFYFLSLRNKF